MSIAKVEPLTTARALRGPFDYRLPERLGEVGVGTVLRVPFGRRRVLGVVVELAEHSSLPPERLAEPIEALAAGAPAELVRLGLWVAHEYCSTPARGLELVLPPGTASTRGQTGARTRTVVAATEAAAEALSGSSGLGPRQRLALELLTAAGEEAPAERLAAAGVGDNELGYVDAGVVEGAGGPVVERDGARSGVGVDGGVGVDVGVDAGGEAHGEDDGAAG
ncbi:MAG: hypothetical protein GEU88_19210, partial [Solirubrobacterales bacterium]|nr:hypothetical protein [Solirubrobacterales bacterium]